MGAKLTEAQRRALKLLASHQELTSAEWDAASTTVATLRRLGFAESAKRKVPRTWPGAEGYSVETFNRITDAGRAALAEAKP